MFVYRLPRRKDALQHVIFPRKFVSQSGKPIVSGVRFEPPACFCQGTLYSVHELYTAPLMLLRDGTWIIQAGLVILPLPNAYTYTFLLAQDSSRGHASNHRKSDGNEHQHLQLFILLLYLHVASLAKKLNTVVFKPDSKPVPCPRKKKRHFMQLLELSIHDKWKFTLTLIIPCLVLPTVQEPLRITSWAGHRRSLAQG